MATLWSELNSLTADQLRELVVVLSFQFGQKEHVVAAIKKVKTDENGKIPSQGTTEAVQHTPALTPTPTPASTFTPNSSMETEATQKRKRDTPEETGKKLPPTQPRRGLAIPMKRPKIRVRPENSDEDNQVVSDTRDGSDMDIRDSVLVARSSDNDGSEGGTHIASAGNSMDMSSNSSDAHRETTLEDDGESDLDIMQKERVKKGRPRKFPTETCKYCKEEFNSLENERCEYAHDGRWPQPAAIPAY